MKHRSFIHKQLEKIIDTKGLSDIKLARIVFFEKRKIAISTYGPGWLNSRTAVLNCLENTIYAYK
ncbi:hypothetical protein [Neobacillus drentensis]|uniref:hypothetical protein n=1 Tax=Neobacillus drentensis TaxID=220684 RepID=UPI0008254A9A|nr:hypothetical protein [Neobacillus drentensis]